ncbi:MAG TPA: glyoxalase [Gammaproteobacteria bacterium]|nr:glyoxalase [Gammaproteobacteria bacterium]|tara:strand:+ start:358 stop:786 length:429 start_codon:yes stop_codon:yes gene_type:complete
MAENGENNDAEEKAETERKPQSNLGKIEWLDLTVDNATRVKDFYAKVVGWSTEDVSMGSYDDFNMNLPGTNTTVAGVCHARGSNANLPAQWLVYVRVANVAESATACEARGGKVIEGPRRMGSSNFVVIEDPAGAVMALISD